MARAVFVLRPEPGLRATIERGRALGLPMVAMPLSHAEPVAWSMPKGAFDGILIGSANALRHAGEALSALSHLPVYAVGEATADAARARGFAIAQVGEGRLQPLIDTLDPARPLSLLHLAGEERLPLDAPAHVGITTTTTYTIHHRPLDEADTRKLAGGGIVLLHSGAVARHFADECDRSGVDRSKLALAALAPRIAASVSQGWQSAKVAAIPQDEALLSLAAEMWH